MIYNYCKCTVFLFLLGLLQAPKATAQDYLFANFNADTLLPTGWTRVNNGNPNSYWKVQAPFEYNFTDLTLLGSNYAFCNGDAGGSGSVTNATLTTVAVNTTAAPTLFLEFDQYYRDYTGTETDTGIVEVFNGTNWIRIQSAVETMGEGTAPVKTKINITAYKNDSLKIRFKYVGEFPFYWLFDNVRIYNPPANDVGVISLSTAGSDCGLPASFPVSVKVVNFGSASQTNFPVLYKVNNLPEVTQNFTGTLAAGDTASFSFTAPFVAPAGGGYFFSSWTGLTADASSFNDSVQNVKLIRAGSTIAPNTFTGYTSDNLETLWPGWTEQEYMPPTGAYSSWSSANTDQVDFFGTETARVNLYSDFKQEWLFTESVIPEVGTVLKFKMAMTDFADTTNDLYSTMGSDDSLNIYVTADCGQTFTRLRSFTSANTLTNQFVEYSVPLSAFAGQSIRIGFYGTDGQTDDDPDVDIHIDDVKVMLPSPNDVGVSAVNPVSGPCGSGPGFTLSVKLLNYGTQTQTNFPVFYSINNGTPVSETFTGSLQPGAELSFNFSQAVSLPDPGTYTIKAWTNLTADVLASNDTSNGSVLRPPTGLGTLDFNAFNGSNLSTVQPGWVEKTGAIPTGQASRWGTSVAVQTTAYGSPTARVNFGSLPLREWLIGPSLSPLANSSVYFQVAVSTHNQTATATMSSDDSVNVMVSTDCGQSWSRIGSYTAANQIPNQLSDRAVSLAGYAGQIIQLAFFATDGPIFNLTNYDFHIDNIYVSTLVANKELLSGLVELFPNPVTDVVNFNAGQNQVLSCQVYNLQGKRMHISPIENGELITLNVSDLPPGSYFVKVETSKGSETKRFVVSR